MFAVEHWGVVPDVICLAKALGGGLPLGAMLARADLVDVWPPAAQGTTFGGNPVACRAGLVSLRIVQEGDLMARVVEVGNFVQDRFREVQRTLPIIGDVRGKGLMVGVELINADGSPAGEIIKVVIADCSNPYADCSNPKEIGASGIALTKCGASSLRFAPPLIITQEQAGEGVDIIIEVLGRHQW